MAVAVVDKIDPWIDTLIANASIGRDAGAPPRGVTADEVIYAAGQLLNAGDCGGRVGANEAHPDGRAVSSAMGEGHHGLGAHQEYAVAGRASDEPYRVVCLPPIGFEGQRQPCIDVCPGTHRRRRRWHKRWCRLCSRRDGCNREEEGTSPKHSLHTRAAP